MTEFSRASRTVDDIEQLMQAVLDGSGDAGRLSRLVGDTAPTIEKLGRKAAETDPARTTYGPRMRGKVWALVTRWGHVEGLAQDVLAQRGLSPVAPAQSPAPAGPAAPAPTASGPPPVPPGGAGGVQGAGAAAAAPAAAAPAAAAASNAQRRETAARAAEFRLGGCCTPASSGLRAGRVAPEAAEPSAAAGAGRPAAAAAVGDEGAAPMEVDATHASAAASLAGAVAVAKDMGGLLKLAHCVFLGHGFLHAPGGAVTPNPGSGPIRVRYTHGNRHTAPIVATYVPVQRHLIVYASLEGAEDMPSKVSVQIGMVTESVQAKLNYLLLYPLLYRQCVPELANIPPEVSFGLLSSLAIPALAAVGFASRALAQAVFDDGVLWWGVLAALPPSEALTRSIDQAREQQRRGEALLAGVCRRLVREEVQRAGAEAEERRRRLEEEAATAQRMRVRRIGAGTFPLPPRRGPRNFPGIGGTTRMHLIWGRTGRRLLGGGGGFGGFGGGIS